MTSLLNAPPGLLGAQLPRVSAIPPRISSAGAEAVELARMAKLNLDPWQEFVLANALGERADGKWAAFEVGLVVSRQNGKGGILEARELAGLFLIDERFIIHSAHQFDTSLEAFGRLLALIEDTPDFDRRVRRVVRSHGEEGITLMSGQRIRFRTRTKGGGRGFTCDCLILDEAMIIPDAMHSALLPTLSARPNPQVWYTGSAVDQDVHEHGVVLARIRERGLRGDDPSLAYFEWSAANSLTEVTPEFANASRSWAVANPALGIRISEEYVANERRSFATNLRGFAVERLGVGDWPSTDPEAAKVIDLKTWRAGIDTDSRPADPLFFAFDVKPDRSGSSIAVAGLRSDGLQHIEVVDQRAGTRWVAKRLSDLMEKHEAAGILCDPAGPAGSLIPDCENLGLEIVSVTAKEYGQACGLIYDAAVPAVDAEQTEKCGTLRHLGTPELEAAIDGAVKRPLGEAWAWSRKNSAVDISPLVACTLALWGAMTADRPIELWAAWE